MKVALGLGTALLAGGALVGCNKGGGGAAQAYNQAPSSTAYTITPGQYETTVKITNGSIEGFPPEEQQRMQQQLQRAQANPMTQRGCIPFGFSLESVALKNLRFSLPNNMGGCNIGDVSQSGGSLSGNMSCEIRNLPQGSPNAPRAITMAANWSGTYTADASATFTMHGEGSEPGGNRRGNVDVEVSSRRVGDCPAGSNPFGPSMSPPAPPAMNSMDGAGSGSGSGNMADGEGEPPQIKRVPTGNESE